jgi:NAD(P)-dependent dehydrogenase (short-subunit alcohol dehydrogenase family)
MGRGVCLKKGRRLYASVNLVASEKDIMSHAAPHKRRGLLIETRLTQVLTAEGASIDVKGRSIAVGVQPKVLESVAARCPLGRAGTAEEAASAVLFFCSPLSDYVTGEVLLCGGGLHF